MLTFTDLPPRRRRALPLRLGFTVSAVDLVTALLAWPMRFPPSNMVAVTVHWQFTRSLSPLSRALSLTRLGALADSGRPGAAGPQSGECPPGMTRFAPPAVQLSRSKLPAQMPLSSCHASERPSGAHVGRKKLPLAR